MIPPQQKKTFAKTQLESELRDREDEHDKIKKHFREMDKLREEFGRS